MISRTRLCAAAAAAVAAGAVASAASVSMSGFDQVAQINTLGGSVKQVGGAANGATLLTAAGFSGAPSTTTGVNVTMAGWVFLQSITSLTDVPPTQVGNVSSVLLGAPTDITFTLPGAGGPDGTSGDGSFSLSQGDQFTASFGQVITAQAGQTKDLFIFTDTDGGGTFRLDLLRNGMVVDSLGATGSAGGAAGSGTGGILVNIVDGTVFDSVRVFAAGSTIEIDAIAVRAVPLPIPAAMGCFGLAGVVGARRRRPAR